MTATTKTVKSMKLHLNIVSKMNIDNLKDGSQKSDNNNIELIPNLNRNLTTQTPPAFMNSVMLTLQNTDPEEQLLIEAKDFVSEKTYLEESTNLQFSDLPNLRDLDSLERQVFEDLEVFNNIGEIEKRNETSSDEKVPKKVPCRRRHEKNVYDCKDKDCGKVFLNVGDLLVHEESHKPQLTCQTCSKVFRTPNQLNRHLKSHSEDVKDPCGVVQSSQKNTGKVEGMLRSNTTRSYKCRSSGCGQVYDNKSELVRHKILQHDMYKNIQKNKVNTRTMAGARRRALSNSHE